MGFTNYSQIARLCYTGLGIGWHFSQKIISQIYHRFRVCSKTDNRPDVVSTSTCEVTLEVSIRPWFLTKPSLCEPLPQLVLKKWRLAYPTQNLLYLPAGIWTTGQLLVLHRCTWWLASRLLKGGSWWPCTWSGGRWRWLSSKSLMLYLRLWQCRSSWYFCVVSIPHLGDNHQCVDHRQGCLVPVDQRHHHAAQFC